MTIDVSAMWDYSNPALSEERFLEALVSASSEDAFILKTQIARTYGIRRDFARAREILASIEPQVYQAGPEAQVRYWLELGRTYSSATHAPETQTEHARAQARKAFMGALSIAKAAGIDELAVDGLHMMAFVDTEPEKQLEWNLEALAYVQASSREAARQWEGSIRNNVGYALHLLGRYDEALQQFGLVLVTHERTGNARGARIARWMIAWTYRTMGRLHEALEIQLQLEKEWEAAGETDPYVFEELEYVYRALGDDGMAAQYANRLAKTRDN